MVADLERILHGIAEEVPPVRDVPLGMLGKARKRVALTVSATLLALSAAGVGAFAAVQATQSPHPPRPAATGPTAVPTASASPTTTRTPNPVWAFLAQQPLHLPTVAPGAACPVSPSSGLPPNHLIPRASWKYWTGVSPVFENGLAQVHYTRSVTGPTEGWYPWKVLWFAAPSYTGPILIRGRQLDGLNEVRFNGKISTDPARTELRHEVPGGRRVWASILFFRAPGCYAVQVDGLGFSKVIVFRAGP